MPIIRIPAFCRRHYTCVCLMLFILAGCTSSPALEYSASSEQIRVPILYVTNRALVSEANKRFTSGRGSPIHGVFNAGVNNEDAQDSRYARLENWQQPQTSGSHPQNQRCESLLSASPCQQLFLSKPQPRTAMLYVHGAGRNFYEVAEHMAILLVEMDFQGIPILFSWPASEDSSEYVGDMNNADWSIPHLQATITDVLANNQFEQVFLVAHSLGNRLMLNSLRNLSFDADVALSKIKHIVMMAPDVDSEIFTRDYLPILNDLNANKTLYVSSKDMPLRVSAWLNGVTRLGDASNGMPVFASIQTIDVSAAHTMFSAHSSYRRNALMQEDLHELLMLNLQPEQRTHLNATSTNDGRYWEIRSE